MPRHAISLLEVLICIFILAVGLLGVAALIPVGRHEMMEAGAADRASNLGRAALRDCKVRRLYLPQQWPIQKLGDPPATIPIETWDLTGCTGLELCVLIDPVYLRANGSTAETRRFPDDATAPLSVPRLDLRAYVDQNAPWMRTTDLAEKLCTGTDDIVFEMPSDRGKRPVERPAASGQRTSENRYSWILMLTYNAADAARQIADRDRLTAHVVVFSTRQTDRGSEQWRQVAELPGRGLGGGDLKLATPAPSSVKAHRWIFLFSDQAAAWYRVVAVSEDRLGLTLTGPDWDAVGSPTPLCVCLPDIVGVFSETVELNRDLLR